MSEPQMGSNYVRKFNHRGQEPAVCVPRLKTRIAAVLGHLRLGSAHS